MEHSFFLLIRWQTDKLTFNSHHCFNYHRCIYVYISINLVFFLTKPSNISKALSILYMNKYCMLYLTYKKENYLFLKKKQKKNCYCFINVNWQYATKRKIYNFMLLNYKIIIILGFFWNRELSIWHQLLTKMYSAIKSCTLKMKQVFTTYGG